MTNKEAIEVIFTEWKCVDRNDGIHCDRKCEDCDLVLPIERIMDAYNMAISALEAQDTNAGDLISRQAAIDAFPDKDGKRLAWDTYNGYAAPHFIRRIIEYLPSARPERKTGKWIWIDCWDIDGMPANAYKCDQCGEIFRDESNFCSNCGAEMTESRDGILREGG